jgi:hypothetical protein
MELSHIHLAVSREIVDLGNFKCTFSNILVPLYLATAISLDLYKALTLKETQENNQQKNNPN